MVDYAVASSERKFRAIVVHCPSLPTAASARLPPWAQQALQVAEGDNVICVESKSEVEHPCSSYAQSPSTTSTR
jgi:hypothetical protein